MTNRLLKGILASASLVGVMTTITPVFADNETGKNTTINYVVAESYTWSAPADFSFTQNVNSESKNGTVSVTKNVIGSKKKIQIGVDPNATFELADTADATNKRTYTLKKNDASQTALAKGSTVLEVNAGTNTGSQGVIFGLNGVSVQKAGTYNGTLNFTAKIVAQ